MKMRILALLLAGILALTLFGCDGGQPQDSTPAGGVETEISKSLGGNPINGFDADGKLAYGGDPSVLVDGDTVYLYVGHDTAPGDSYVIPEYLCYSTKDLVTWKYEGVVLSMKDVPWADNNSAWAGQVAKHYSEAQGKDLYYFYYCSWNNKDAGKQGIGVAVSESPTGPFVDIGAPIVAGSVTTDETSAWNDIDPTIWIETDSKGVEHRYLCWGNGKVYMCELNEDMVSVKDYNGDGKVTFKQDIISQVVPSAYTEGPWIYRRTDENGKAYGEYYIFYASGWRERLAYSTCDNIMEGMWFYGAMLMEPTATSNTNHPAVFDFNGKTYMIYHNGALVAGNGFRRSACIAELVFDKNGVISYVNESSLGVSGVASTLTTLNGEVLTHANFANSGDDAAYPYDDIALGSKLPNTVAEDAQWEIEQGLHDATNVYYVSLQSVNKPGMYVFATDSTAVLSHCYNAKLTDGMTFKTVTGLGGEGISFESITNPGLYLTLSGGKVSLTDGSDAKACSFNIQQVTE